MRQLQVTHPQLSEADYRELYHAVDTVAVAHGLHAEGLWRQGDTQILVHGPQCPTEAVPALAAVARTWSADLGPADQYRGPARTQHGEPVQVQGQAAELFQGNVFDRALDGHPASAQFLVRMLCYGDENSRDLVLRSLDDRGLRESARAQLEAVAGISFHEQELVYAKGADGLGNVYRLAELQF